MINPFRRLSETAGARLPHRLYGEEILAASVFAVFILLLSAQSLFAHEFKVGSIEIDHPWARATPNGAAVGGGYLVLKNTGTADDRLVSATATVAQRVEIHEMSIANGVMTMRPVVGGLVVPANGSVALKPGSYHIMFMGLKQPLKQGTPFEGTLTFEKAGTVNVKYVVDAIAASGSDHDHMQMGK